MQGFRRHSWAVGNLTQRVVRSYAHVLRCWSSEGSVFKDNCSCNTCLDWFSFYYIIPNYLREVASFIEWKHITVIFHSTVKCSFLINFPEQNLLLFPPEEWGNKANKHFRRTLRQSTEDWIGFYLQSFECCRRWILSSTGLPAEATAHHPTSEKWWGVLLEQRWCSSVCGWKKEARLNFMLYW